jgi:hypothetical protein
MAIAIKVPGPHIEAMAIKEAEKELASGFPDDYRRFLLTCNGGTPETNEFDIPATENGSGINYFYSILGTDQDGDLLREQYLLTGRLPHGVIGIGDAEGGNLVCLSLRAQDHGTVFFWDHELEAENDAAAALAKLAPTFDAFFSLLQKFDPQSVQLSPGQVERVWIDPDFLKNLKREKAEGRKSLDDSGEK